jgi:single-strand DNA-binding protein
MGINIATLSGNVGQDPETRYTPSSTAITTFTIAVEGYDGKKKEKKTLWFNCKAFNQPADVINKYVKKGNTITVSGQLDVEEWTTQSGEKRSKTVLIVRDVQLPAKSGGPVTGSLSSEDILSEGDIPF